jgi:hypothetical protein
MALAHIFRVGRCVTADSPPLDPGACLSAVVPFLLRLHTPAHGSSLRGSGAPLCARLRASATPQHVCILTKTHGLGKNAP